MLPSIDLAREKPVLFASYYEKNRFVTRSLLCTWCACFDVPPGLQTAGWNAVGDKDGVPVWAADTLAFKGTGANLKVNVALHGGTHACYLICRVCNVVLMLVVYQVSGTW